MDRVIHVQIWDIRGCGAEPKEGQQGVRDKQ